ncbi:DUF2202 domain-containing protein [Thiothrix subterranea]|uniref:DUF2202 domain-containing protein n=1 Tax=Thiothrix subterranea TaxID=2735563 RepID=UPI00192C2404|nr:DUF2202 domain-containing protein [Thiothrix subterranea]QQZ29469.1 DUF2202 domain-containing protein [Thiothrix subterranea]
MTFRKTLIAGMIAIACTGLLTTPTFAKGNGQQQAQAQVLSAAETQSLRFMREEEKLARDAYISLYQQWQLPVFNNISQSEQQHTDKVKALLQTYRIADPVTNDAVGVFQNVDLAALYATLMARGQTSALDALYVGALIEEVDIVDLQKSMRETTRPDLLSTYDNLMRASRNHLRAFVGQIKSQGVTYVAQTMPQAEVDAIVNSPNERGGQGAGNGRGQGRGQGRGM